MAEIMFAIVVEALGAALLVVLVTALRRTFPGPFVNRT